MDATHALNQIAAACKLAAELSDRFNQLEIPESEGTARIIKKWALTPNAILVWDTTGNGRTLYVRTGKI